MEHRFLTGRDRRSVVPQLQDEYSRRPNVCRQLGIPVLNRDISRQPPKHPLQRQHYYARANESLRLHQYPRGVAPSC